MPRRLREVAGDELGDFYKFEKLGDYVEGVFEKERTTTGEYGQQQVFDIRQESGQLLTLNGTWDLKSKMAKVQPGTFVRIEWVSNKELPPLRNGNARNPMMIFRVQVDEDAQPAPVKKSPF